MKTIKLVGNSSEIFNFLEGLRDLKLKNVSDTYLINGSEIKLNSVAVNSPNLFKYDEIDGIIFVDSNRMRDNEQAIRFIAKAPKKMLVEYFTSELDSPFEMLTNIQNDLHATKTQANTYSKLTFFKIVDENPEKVDKDLTRENSYYSHLPK